MKIFLSFLIEVCLLSLISTTISNFEQLDDENLKKMNNFLVLFHETDDPQYSDYINLLSALNDKFKKNEMMVSISKLDINANHDLAMKYKAFSAPMIRYISAGEDLNILYKGEPTIEDIYRFIEIRMKKEIKEIKDLEEFENLKNSQRIFILVCDENLDGLIFKDANKISFEMDDLNVFWTRSNDLKTQLNCTQEGINALIIKNFDENYVNFNSLNYDTNDFIDWVSLYSSPIVLELNNENIETSLSEQIPSIQVILSEEIENSKEIYEIFYNQGKIFRRDLLMMITSNNSPITSNILNFFGEKSAPLISALTYNMDGSVNKFKYLSAKINEKKINKWILALLEGKLKKYYLSEKPVEQNLDENGLEIIVGDNFSEKILNSDKNYLLLIYYTNCEECRVLEEILIKIKNDYKNQINFAKINKSLNDHEYLINESLPDLFAYRGNQNFEEKLKNKGVYKNSYENESEIRKFIEDIFQQKENKIDL